MRHIHTLYIVLHILLTLSPPEQTTFGIGVTYSAKFSIPEVVEFDGATTISTQVANSYGETYVCSGSRRGEADLHGLYSTSGTSKHQVTTKVVANHADGKTCKLDVRGMSCLPPL